MPASAQSAAPASRQRIALFDNLKGLLIILVVFGHMMHPIHNDNPVLSACFDIIYLFHMPLFVLLSGLFAKSTYRDGRLNIDRIISFAVLGIVFQIALLLVNGSPITPLKILRFPSATWYLIAMAWWSAFTPALSKLGPKRGLALSVLASLGIGFVELEGGFLALSRTLAFLPWFSLGYYLTCNELIRIKSSRLLWAAVFLSALIALARIAEPNAYGSFFAQVFGDNPYNGGSPGGILAKLIASIVAFLFSLAVLKIMPSHRCALTTLGRRTFQVYILHRLMRAALTFRTSFYEMSILLDPVAGTVIIAVLTTTALVLSTLSCLEKPFNDLLTTKWTRLVSSRSRGKNAS